MSKVNARQRGNTWQYYFEGARINGKRNRIHQSGFETRKAALKAGNEALYKYLNGGMVSAPAELSVSDFLDEWLKDAIELNRASNTYLRYKDVVERRLKPAVGTFHLKALNSPALQSILNGMQAEGLRASTMQFTKNVMTAAFKYAVHPRKYVNESPAQYLTLPKAKKKPLVKDAITVETFNRIIKEFPRGTNLYLPAIIAFYTGLRKSEVLGLTWDCVDLENKTITVQKQLVKRPEGWGFGELKTQSSYRVIKIGNQLIKRLEKQKARTLRNRVRLGEVYTVQYMANDGELIEGYAGDMLTPVIAYPICVKDNGAIITPNNIEYCMRKVHKELELPNVSFHTFRHTHATLLIEQGANIKSVSVRLGHSDVATTLETYAHVTERMESETVEAFENVTGEK